MEEKTGCAPLGQILILLLQPCVGRAPLGKSLPEPGCTVQASPSQGAKVLKHAVLKVPFGLAALLA